MIETTFIRLEKAAAMLETDLDTLLLASVEGRIRLYGFFGRFVDAYKFGGSWRVGEEEPIEVNDDDDAFTFVPVGINEAIDLFREGFFQANILSEPDVNGHYWEVDDVSWADGTNPKPDLKIAMDHIFMKRADVEKIKSEGKTPDAESVPEQKRHKVGGRAESTYLNIIGGLLSLALGQKDNGDPLSSYSSQAEIIADLVDRFPTANGISKSNLESKFAEAKRAIKQT